MMVTTCIYEASNTGGNKKKFNKTQKIRRAWIYIAGFGNYSQQYITHQLVHVLWPNKED